LSHLFLGTARDNAIDKMRKGRGCEGERHFNAKLTRQQIRQIRKDPRSSRTIAPRYGVNRSTISRIKRGDQWASVTLWGSP
jgi:hypothetical protein